MTGKATVINSSQSGFWSQSTVFEGYCWGQSVIYPMIQLYLCISCPTILPHFSYKTLLRRKWAPRVWLVKFIALFSLAAKCPNSHPLKRNSCVTFTQWEWKLGDAVIDRTQWRRLESGCFKSRGITLRFVFRDTNCVVSNPTCLTSRVRGDRLLFSQSVFTCLASYAFADFHSLPQHPGASHSLAFRREKKMKKPSGLGLGFLLAMNRIEVFIRPTLGRLS